MNNIWDAVKEVKLNTPLKDYPKYCFSEGLYESASYKMDHVKTVERILKIESSELRFNNISIEKCKVAAEMFIYLNICPKYDWYNWFNSWNLFYNDLFNNHAPDEILLTLNRIMKSDIAHNDLKDEITVAEKLFRKLTKLSGLTFIDKLQNMLPGGAKNISGKNGHGKNINNEGWW